MIGWQEFVATMAVFLAAHAIPVRPRIKGAIVAVLGRRGFGIGYSLLSTGLLIWVIVAAGRAPFVSLWAPAPWQAALAVGLMLIASLLAAYALAGVNPLSFGSRAAPFDPLHPGIAGVTRHPVLWALALWGVAHLTANGDLAHLILFGVMTAFALLGMALIDRRKRREWGRAAWQEQAHATAVLPLWALLSGRWRPRTLPRLVPGLAALLVWAGLIALHPVVIGVDPLALWP